MCNRIGRKKLQARGQLIAGSWGNVRGIARDSQLKTPRNYKERLARELFHLGKLHLERWVTHKISTVKMGRYSKLMKYHERADGVDVSYRQHGVSNYIVDIVDNDIKSTMSFINLLADVDISATYQPK